MPSLRRTCQAILAASGFSKLHEKLTDLLHPYGEKPGTICLFVSYVPDGDHSVDARLLQDLQRLFSNLIVLTNVAPTAGDFSYRVYPNRGYDFGYWYQALLELDMSGYDRLVLLNNSNFLVRARSLSSTMRWGDGCGYDFWGLTDSHEAPAGLKKGECYHVQSHFMVVEKSAMDCFSAFFRKLNFPKFYEIRDPSVLREAIINECEIGLTQHMLAHGLRVGTKFPAHRFIPSVSALDWHSTNMHMMLWEELIKAGYPLLKKKIPQKDWPFLPNLAAADNYLQATPFFSRRD